MNGVDLACLECGQKCRSQSELDKHLEDEHLISAQSANEPDAADVQGALEAATPTNISLFVKEHLRSLPVYE